MLKNQKLILELFRKNIFLKTSILNLSKLLKKSYPKIYDAVKILESNKILNVEKIGNTKQVSLILNHTSIQNLSLLDEQSNIPNYEKIINLKEISQYLILITGSYIKGTANKQSDLDLVVIVPDNQNAMEIQKLVENLTILYHPKVHLYVLNNKDFIEMLLDKKENYGKEIFKNHVILKNAYIYYENLKEALEHGFRG